MVVDTVCGEYERLRYSVEGVSPSCSSVTQSPRAMNDTTFTTRGQRKYHNTNPSYVAQSDRTEPSTRAVSPDSMNTLTQASEGRGDVSPRVDSEGPSTLGVKKKALQKLASGAIANIGSVFRGGANDQLEGRADSSPGRPSRATKIPANIDAHNLTLDPDPGTQEKLPQKERFFNKAWRNRPKGIPNAGNSLWVPEDDCSWSSARGARIQLANTELSTLSEPECIALQKVAQARLRQMDFQSHVTIPKDSRSARKSLKRALSWKTKNSGSSFFEKDKDGGVFAIPLHKAVTAQGSNDQTEQKKTQKNLSPSMSSPPSATSTSTLEAPNDSPTSRRHSSSSLSQNPQPSSVEQSSEESNNNEASTSKETPLETPSWKSRLIDALTLLSSSTSTSFLLDKHGGLNPTQPQVPSIVLKAVEHLQLYGLHVLGIFRVGGSKKRMKQMRDQFDSGEKKEFTAEDNPHDVAALFKEYFRDLPEPLLTRDLYSAFLETQNFDNQNMQITALRLLCCLLPTPNRDTLKVLLDFLAEVASFAEDGADENGIEILGNKMTLGNLAIIIGPNILHKVKGQHYDFLVEDKARADERKEIIDVVQDMIEHHNELFEVSAEMHHEALIHLLEGEPEIHDYIMKRLMRTNGTDVEDHIFPMEGVADEQTTRGRVQSAGAAERPLARVSSAPSTHPLADSNWRTRPHPGPHSVTRSGSDKGTYSPMIPTRSQSLNQEEGRHFFHGFNRQLSSPDDTLSPVAHNHNYRQNKRKTPPLTRSSCRYDGSSSCEPPPSPALSSRSPSWSNYSTPPSSPSGSTAFVSADSSSSSPITGRAYVTDEGSTIAELTSLLTEVEVELTHEGGEYPRRLQIDPETFTVPDWQLENWLQWETLTRQNSSQKDFLEQETLV